MALKCLTSKRGDISSIIFLAIITFFFAVAGVAVYYVSGEVTDKIRNVSTEMDLSPSALAAVNDTLTEGFNKTMPMLDKVLLFIFVGLVISMIVSAYYTASNPLFLPIYIIVWIVAIVISAPLSNIWSEFSAYSDFTTAVADFPIMNNILNNLPWVIGVFGAVILVVLYAKRRSDSTGGGGYF